MDRNGVKRSDVGAKTPHELHRMFEEACNAGDLEAVMSTYEPGAVIRDEPGVVVSGTESIRAVFANFLSTKPVMKLEMAYVFDAGDVALTCSRWTAKGTDPEGSEFELSGEGVEVLRRQSDGTWLTVIDNAYGTADLDALSGKEK
jgi:ketosteroid isomerase-like protein